MNFVLVNHRTPRKPSCCAACSRPFQRSYLRDLSTSNRYCGVECYPGLAADSTARSLVKTDSFDLVAPFSVLPKVTIDVASTILDCAARD
jgi:hypothetical protein